LPQLSHGASSFPFQPRTGQGGLCASSLQQLVAEAEDVVGDGLDEAGAASGIGRAIRIERCLGQRAGAVDIDQVRGCHGASLNCLSIINRGV
jgi:hypothetical protein